MIFISKPDFDELVNLLLPHLMVARETFVTQALYDAPTLLSQVNFEGSARDFTIGLIQACIRFGEISPGHLAVIALLDQLSHQVGFDQQEKCTRLMKSIVRSYLVTSNNPIKLSETSDHDVTGLSHLNSLSTENEHYFVSYSRVDFPLVHRLIQDLQSQGLKLWIDTTGLKVGTSDWEATLRDAIEQAKGVILVASPDARKSVYVRDEIAIARSIQRPIYPVWIAGNSWSDSIPMGMGYIQFLDLRGESYTSGLEKLIFSLKNEISHAHATVDFSRTIAASISKSELYNHIENIFVQFINPEILSLYGVSSRFRVADVILHAKKLLKYCFLITESKVIMAASYLFEVPFLGSLIQELRPAIEEGVLVFASSSPDFREYSRRKQMEYRDELSLFPNYKDPRKLTRGTLQSLVWLPKVSRASSDDIAKLWRQELMHDEGIWATILRENGGQIRSKTLTQVESDIDAVPARLDGRAFIFRYAKRLLPIQMSLKNETRVSMLISKGYLFSYLEELDAVILIDTPLGLLDAGLSQYSADGHLRTLAFSKLHRLLNLMNVAPFLESRLSIQDILFLRNDAAFRLFIRAMVEVIAGNHLSWEFELIKHSVKPFAPKHARRVSVTELTDYFRQVIHNMGLLNS